MYRYILILIVATVRSLLDVNYCAGRWPNPKTQSKNHLLDYIHIIEKQHHHTAVHIYPIWCLLSWECRLAQSGANGNIISAGHAAVR